MGYLSSNRQLFSMKHLTGISATGQNMVRRGERNTDKCLRCNKPDEHNEHIIRCNKTGAESTFQTAHNDMGVWLHQTTTPDIENAITDLVLEYRTGLEPTENQEFPEGVQMAILCQRSIGLFPLMFGILCSNWANLQDQYFHQIGS